MGSIAAMFVTTCACAVLARMDQRTCLKCHAAYMRANRTRHSDLIPKARQRANARSYANVYVRRGLLAKLPCESCGSEDSQMHHEDYGKPLTVQWLCVSCHLQRHFDEDFVRPPWVSLEEFRRNRVEARGTSGMTA